jgi:uncharacterized phage protein gp47/JayE
MPWTTPSLKTVRQLTRDAITASLYGAAFIGNNVLRVMSDAMAGLAHHTLRYIDWLALQLLPDTAENEWLDRHGQIWLTNADGSRGRKLATYATGIVTVTGTAGAVVPQNSTLLGFQQVRYETTAQIIVAGLSPTPVNVLALDSGAIGNLPDGQTITFSPPLTGVDSAAIVYGELSGGTDAETYDELRARILLRIQQPPVGGDAKDYVQWTLAVPGVTRAWCAPLEQGIGTVTVRFMCDDLRADQDGFPQSEDIDAVTAYVETVRPVAVKDVFYLAPIPFPIDLGIHQLVTDNAATREAIEVALVDMLLQKAFPGGTIYASWVEAAISETVGVDHFELVFTTATMPSLGHLAVLGTISYG